MHPRNETSAASGKFRSRTETRGQRVAMTRVGLHRRSRHRSIDQTPESSILRPIRRDFRIPPGILRSKPPSGTDPPRTPDDAALKAASPCCRHHRSPKFNLFPRTRPSLLPSTSVPPCHLQLSVAHRHTRSRGRPVPWCGSSAGTGIVSCKRAVRPVVERGCAKDKISGSAHPRQSSPSRNLRLGQSDDRDIVHQSIRRLQ